MSTVLDFSLGDAINCSICLRQFDTNTRKPKVLHCGHTVCEDCTRRVGDDPLMVAIRCPTCREYTHRPSINRPYTTNFQVMAMLEEKEKQDAEAKKKPAKKPEQRFQFRMARTNKLKVHVATKKGLKGPEMYIRKDSSGDTQIVFMGKTGSTSEVVKFINDNSIGIETGNIGTRIIQDTGKGKGSKFAKVTEVAAGQSGLKMTGPPSKLEEAEMVDTFELQAAEVDGKISLQLKKTGDKANGTEVFGGSMAKPTAKRALKKNDDNEPSTSSASSAPDAPVGPVSKRTRRGRAAK